MKAHLNGSVWSPSELRSRRRATGRIPDWRAYLSKSDGPEKCPRASPFNCHTDRAAFCCAPLAFLMLRDVCLWLLGQRIAGTSHLKLMTAWGRRPYTRRTSTFQCESAAKEFANAGNI